MKKTLSTAVAVAVCEAIGIYLSIAWPLGVDQARRLGDASSEVLGWVLAGAGPYVLLGTVVGTVIGVIVLSRTKPSED